MECIKSLNDQLAKALSKFGKACEQIEQLKRRCAELITMYTYAEEAAAVRGSIFNSNGNDDDDDENYAAAAAAAAADNSRTVYRECLRQQIESLQSVKTAYFVYAHAKADEITQLQCQIYGETTVRDAYEAAPPSALIAASTSSSVDDVENRNENENEYETTGNTTDDDNYDFHHNVALTDTDTDTDTTDDNDNHNDGRRFANTEHTAASANTWINVLDSVSEADESPQRLRDVGGDDEDSYEQATFIPNVYNRAAGFSQLGQHNWPNSSSLIL